MVVQVRSSYALARPLIPLLPDLHFGLCRERSWIAHTITC